MRAWASPRRSTPFLLRSSQTATGFETEELRRGETEPSPLGRTAGRTGAEGTPSDPRPLVARVPQPLCKPRRDPGTRAACPCPAAPPHPPQCEWQPQPLGCRGAVGGLLSCWPLGTLHPVPEVWWEGLGVSLPPRGDARPCYWDTLTHSSWWVEVGPGAQRDPMRGASEPPMLSCAAWGGRPQFSEPPWTHTTHRHRSDLDLYQFIRPEQPPEVGMAISCVRAS